MHHSRIENHTIEKIGVIGPGIVGMPMAAMLAQARIKTGNGNPAHVVIVQRNSASSGWKVDAINHGKSVIGGIEPQLDEITATAVKEGLLSASHDFNVLSNADVVLVAVQTDKKGFEPDYRPLSNALHELALALRKKPVGKTPLIIFESTLAPSTMDTVIREHFKKYGLNEGKDILLGNSPNRVMPGRLVERIRDSDKLAGGLHPGTPEMITQIYKHIVTSGKIYQTNCLTAEIVKTLENAYRDLRIAFSAKTARYCDEHNINFYRLRDEVNRKLAQTDSSTLDPNAVPTGGILIPMLGVGGHCLPKDGILLWWRKIQAGCDTTGSSILNSRLINDEAPVNTFQQAEKFFGSLRGKKLALLGVAYRFNSEDTRNSPTLALANYLRNIGTPFKMHDPYVNPEDQNLLKYNHQSLFTKDLNLVLKDAEYVFMCTAHKDYLNPQEIISYTGKSLKGIMDACNIYQKEFFDRKGIAYTGIGRGSELPDKALVESVYLKFRSMESELARELQKLIDFYNSKFAYDEFNKVKFSDVQKLAGTCSTGCLIAGPEPVLMKDRYESFENLQG